MVRRFVNMPTIYARMARMTRIKKSVSLNLVTFKPDFPFLTRKAHSISARLPKQFLKSCPTFLRK